MTCTDLFARSRCCCSCYVTIAISSHHNDYVIIVPASSPVNLSFSKLMITSLTLLWCPPLPDDQNGVILNYMIEFVGLQAHNSSIFITDSTFLDIAELQPFTSYSFSVAAATAVGFGPASEHHMVQTTEDGESGI